MFLSQVTSPHVVRHDHTRNIMRRVILAAVPGLLVSCWFFGLGPLFNLLLCSLFAIGFESLILKLRQRPIGFYLNDYSVLVTAVLLGLALPPWAPWWLLLVATGFAVVFGKQLFGGLGQNPFNPAMLGYVVVLVSFPVDMTRWPAAHSVTFSGGLAHMFAGVPWPDAWSQATVLDALKNNAGLTLDELWGSYNGFGWLSSRDSELINLAFLLGGLWLLYKKTYSWHAPVGMLGALFVISLLFWGGSGSESHGSPLFHLFSGATMLGAFFITDPVSSATSTRGRLLFGIGVGILIYIIRSWGGYPDAIAFSVLLMNLCAPTLDYFTRPRSYGHSKAKRGFNSEGQ